MYKEGRVDFAKVTTFNLDEYLGIPNDHPERYYNFMAAICSTT
jgi:glucosamine-6-phosphate deaminase